MADSPSDAAVREWAQGLSDGALRCRTMPSKHQPVETTVTEETLEGSRRKVYIQNYRCRHNCGCTWQEIIDVRTGYRFRLDIHYPGKGRYLAPPGFGRITTEQIGILRLERMNRQTAKRRAS